MTFLLDTNIISELRRPNCDPNVHAWFASVHGSDLFLSVLVLGEIRQGIERLRRRGDSRAALYEVWLERLAHDYAGRVVPITHAIADEWGQLNARNQLPVIDGLQAATAIVLGLTFVTRNVQDVVSSGVTLLNPFERPSWPDLANGDHPGGEYS